MALQGLPQYCEINQQQHFDGQWLKDCCWCSWSGLLAADVKSFSSFEWLWFQVTIPRRHNFMVNHHKIISASSHCSSLEQQRIKFGTPGMWETWWGQFVDAIYDVIFLALLNDISIYETSFFHRKGQRSYLTAMIGIHCIKSPLWKRKRSFLSSLSGFD